MKINNIIILCEVLPGTSLDTAVHELRLLAKTYQLPFRTEFNGKPLTARVDGFAMWGGEVVDEETSTRATAPAANRPTNEARLFAALQSLIGVKTLPHAKKLRKTLDKLPEGEAKQTSIEAVEAIIATWPV